MVVNDNLAEQPKKNVNEQLADYGITAKDTKELVKETQNAYKMIFEQVLLVMIYVRELLTNGNISADIGSRMNFLHLLFKDENPNEERKTLQEKILGLLESDKGSNDIIFYLQDLNSDEAKSVLGEIQSQRIAFAPLTTPLARLHKTYSYYQMYKCLLYPIEIFQELLKQKNYDVGEMENFLYNQIKGNKIDKKNILLVSRTELAKQFGEWASKVFALISNPAFSKKFNESLWDFRKNFNKFYSIADTADSYVLKTDRKVIRALQKLNQLDDFFEDMKNELMAKIAYGEAARSSTPKNIINNGNALKEVSDWYVRYGTDLLNKIDQIPKAVVTIIDFDFQNRIPSLDKVLSDAYKLKAAYKQEYDERYLRLKFALEKARFTKYDKISEIIYSLKRNNYPFSYGSMEEKRAKATPIKDRNELLTYIITTNLYIQPYEKEILNLIDFKGFLDLVRTHNATHLEKLGEGKNRSDRNKKLLTYPNEIMQGWTVFQKNSDGTLNAEFNIFERERMMYRFKSIPVQFTKKHTVNYMISSQWDIINAKPFPYTSTFPCPLWLEFLPDIEEKDTNVNAEQDANSNLG